MNLRRALVLIDEVDVSADARQEPERAADRRQQAARERVVEDRSSGTSLSARRLDERASSA